MRKKTVAANWKMNMTPKEAKSFLDQLIPQVKDSNVDIIICAPFVTIQTVLDSVSGSRIKVGAEDMFYEDKGAYTGEISPIMLKEIGITHVIIGHSERRKYFGETNGIANKKILKALEYDMVPMACCGESLEIRGDGLAKQYIHRQVMEMLQGVTKEDVTKCIFSYEPIWAIGTGIGATKEQAEEGCTEIRRSIASIYGEEVADNVTILYGGSVNPGNAETIFAIENIDGGLLGTASLNMDFAKVIKMRENM
ncbi:MAG: triose-phosphate isomerase [Lachnospiraceae bacterium]|nr:triose-phosphate isomerase [Lachnospiraceae bacterium]